MSYVATSVATTAAIAEKQRLEREEEEEMTPYTPEELDSGWEFKIVRSSTNAFGKPENLKKLTEQEALAGWIMVEKFDNGRVRFKRSSSAKKQDATLPTGADPYKTTFGMSEAVLALMIVIGVAVLAGCGVLAMLLFPLIFFG